MIGSRRWIRTSLPALTARRPRLDGSTGMVELEGIEPSDSDLARITRDPIASPVLVDPIGLEPTASAVRKQRSPRMSYGPRIGARGWNRTTFAHGFNVPLYR